MGITKKDIGEEKIKIEIPGSTLLKSDSFFDENFVILDGRFENRAEGFKILKFSRIGLFFRDAQMLFFVNLKSLLQYLAGALRENVESGCLFRTTFEAFSMDIT